VNERLEEGKTISRASVIFFLNRMLDQGVLKWRDATGKGGHHKIYITKLDERGYEKYIVRTLLESVAKDFPEATKEVLQAF
jgi:predicted transcriptional regulator